MVGVYDALLSGVPVGTVQVTREGLYYAISCTCRIPGEMIHRLTAFCAEAIPIGILVPEQGGFVLQTRIPVKRFPAGKPEFRILPKHAPLDIPLIPLSPEEPFQYLQRLKDAYLVRKREENKLYIGFRQKEEAYREMVSPTGQ